MIASSGSTALECTKFVRAAHREWQVGRSRGDVSICRPSDRGRQRQSVGQSVAGATHCELPLRSKHGRTCAVWAQCELQSLGQTAENEGAL